MTTVYTRQTTATGAANQNVPLTNAQVDQNFITLNQNKFEKDGDTHLTLQNQATATAERKLVWDDGEGAPVIGLKGGNVALPIGQRQVLLCYNGTGATLVKGSVVYVITAQGQRPSVALANATQESTSQKTLGVVQEQILNTAEGYITTFGMLDGVDTSAFIAGSALWLNTSAGGLTTTKPTQPNHLVFVGYCIKSHAAQGRIFINPQNGYELDELHDVLITSRANGDVLQFDSTAGVWKNVPAVSTNTASTLVKRDANGDFQAGTVTAQNITINGSLNVGATITNANNYLSLANPGIGYGNGFAFTRGTDGAGIRVIETANDQTMYELWMQDNPDGGDMFQVRFTDYQSQNGLTVPFQTQGIANRYVAQQHSVWGQLVQNTGSFYTTSNFAATNGADTQLIFNTIGKTGTQVTSLTLTQFDVQGYNGNSGALFWIKLTATNTFQWGYGSTASTAVATGLAVQTSTQTLSNGIAITFQAASGTIGDIFAARVWKAPSNTFGPTQITQLTVSSNITLPQQTANTVLAAPNGAAGVPTFRALVAADIPTLNQSTTGSAATLTTARTLTIGSTGKTFNGSADVSWSLAEIGAAATTHNHTTLTGITSIGFAAEGSDSASLSTTINGTGTYFDFNLTDDNNSDWWRWRFTPSGQTVYDAMTLKPSANGVSDLVVAGKVTGTQLVSNIATGTSPLTVTQTTLVQNLNADLLDGNHASAFYLATNPSGYTTNTGTVTSVGGTGTVSGLTLSGTVTSSGNLTLGGTLSVTASNFQSQTANTFLAAPNGAAGTPTFRAIVAADIPTLNQNTTGTASNVTGTVAIANGGTGATTAAAALTNLGAYAATNPSGYTSNTGTVTSVALSLPQIFSVSGSPVTTSGTLTATLASQTAATVFAAPSGVAGAPSFRALVASDIPTLNQSTTGSAATLTTARTLTIGSTGKTFNGSADVSWTLAEIGALGAQAKAADSDKLDGLDSSVFIYGNGQGSNSAPVSWQQTQIQQYKQGFWDINGASWTPDTGWWWGTTVAHTSNGAAYLYGAQMIFSNSLAPQFYIRGMNGGAAGATGQWQKVWMDSNDGSGSGLDADLLDGNHAQAFYLATNPSGYTSNTGTVTSVSGTGTVSGLTLSGTVTSSGNLTLGGTLSVTASNFPQQTANTFLAAPNGAAGTPTFRAIVAADIPTLNQSTTGNAATATTASSLSGFTNSTSSSPIVGADALTNNGIGYVNSISLLSQTDGALYAQAYSTSWVHQIYGDYRTGQIAIRGKNNGTWQAWRTVLDSSNYSSWAAAANHNHVYNVNDAWLRDNGDDANVKLYGNSRQMAFRTDGTTEYATGVGGYPFAWMYGGDAVGNRLMLLNTSGDLWTSTNGWLSTALAGKQAAGSYLTAESDTLATVTSRGNATTNPITAGYIGINNSDSTTGYGVSLYSAASAGQPTYGLMFAGTTTFGSHGGITTGNWATYFTMNNTAGRGWVFRDVTTPANVASITNTGLATFDDSVRSPVFYDSDNTAWYVDPAGTSAMNGVISTWVGAMRSPVIDTGSTSVGTSAKTLIKGKTASGHFGLTVQGDKMVMNFITNANYDAITNSSTTCFYTNINGDVTAAGSVTAYSDIRLKADIKKIDSALDKVSSISGYTYTRTDSGLRQTGLIAQELEKVLPEAVIQPDSEEGFKSVAYGNVVGLLVEAIKEQQTQIDELKTMINKLLESKK